MILTEKSKKVFDFRLSLSLAWAFVGVFLNIFVFKMLGSVKLAILGNIIFHLGIFIGLGVLGYLFSILRWNIKNTFPYGLLVSAFSFLVLLLGNDPKVIFTFMLIWGFGQGLTWYGVNSLELHKVHADDREYYTSKLGLYAKILSVTVPLLLTVSFYFFQDYTYLLIFLFSGTCTLASFYFSKNIIDFVPPRIPMKEIKKFLVGENSFYVLSYTILDGMSQTLEMMLPPIAAYLILKTEVNVGIYTEIASVISIILLYVGIKYRKKRSKESVYMLVTLLYMPFMLLLAFYPSLYPFIIFSAATLIFGPQLQVSKHNVDLFTMSQGQRGSSTGQGELKKIKFDPLFSLNHTCAMLRANVSRLFRKTWCTTKRPDQLRAHLMIYAEYHNSQLSQK
jgi:sugar phosphate permease